MPETKETPLVQQGTINCWSNTAQNEMHFEHVVGHMKWQLSGRPGLKFEFIGYQGSWKNEADLSLGWCTIYLNVYKILQGTLNDFTYIGWRVPEPGAVGKSTEVHEEEWYKIHVVRLPKLPEGTQDVIATWRRVDRPI